MSEEEDLPGNPVCYAHKLVGGHIVDEQTWKDVSRFRRSERTRLVQKRQRMSGAERTDKTAALIANLRLLLKKQDFRTITAYWPIRGEPDLRPLLVELHEAGRTVLLPVVAQKGQPLIFRPWHPGCDMIRGIWNIPVPAGGTPQLPQVVLAPLVGADAENFRLGNGGGYYDRTLVSLPQKPMVVGVGFALCRIPTIFPMPWDIQMNAVVTEEGTGWPPRETGPDVTA